MTKINVNASITRRVSELSAALSNARTLLPWDDASFAPEDRDVLAVELAELVNEAEQLSKVAAPKTS